MKKENRKEKKDMAFEQQHGSEQKKEADFEQQLERELSQVLEEGEMSLRDPQQTARELLPPKYEVRIQAEQDIIVEETKWYRQMAQEVDDRYDKYMERYNRVQDVEVGGEDAPGGAEEE